MTSVAKSGRTSSRARKHRSVTQDGKTWQASPRAGKHFSVAKGGEASTCRKGRKNIPASPRAEKHASVLIQTIEKQ